MSDTAYHASAAAAEDLDRVLAEIANEIEERAEDLAARIADEIHAEMPEFGSHARVTARTRTVVRANLSGFNAIMRDGVPSRRVEVSPETIEYARAFVHRHIDLSLIVRCYRLAHARMWRTWSEAIESRALSGEARTALIGVMSASMFEFIDHVTAELVAEYARERAAWNRSPDALRAETVDAILAGEPVDLDSASRVLGYDLRRWHVGLVLWDDRDDDGADRSPGLLLAAGEVATRLAGSERFLSVPSGGSVLRAWIASDTPPRGDTIDGLVSEERIDGVRAALGDPGRGLEGFRRTHDRAQVCRRIMQLSGALPGNVRRFGDVALPAVLAADLDLMREFVLAELGGLAADDDATRRLRATLTVFFEERSSPARTGRRLGIHTNTVKYRIGRCAELRGRPLRDRPLDLQVALMLRDTLSEVGF